MRRLKFLYYESLKYEPEVIRRIKEHFEFMPLLDPTHDGDDILHDIDVCLAPLGFPFDKSKIDCCPQLKIIGSSTLSIPHIDTEYALSKGIKDVSSISSASWANKPNNGIRIVLKPQEYYEDLTLPPGVRQLTANELQQHLDKTIEQESNNQNWQLAINQATTNQILALRVESQSVAQLELVMPSQKSTLTPTRVIIFMEEKI